MHMLRIHKTNTMMGILLVHCTSNTKIPIFNSFQSIFIPAISVKIILPSHLVS